MREISAMPAYWDGACLLPTTGLLLGVWLCLINESGGEVFCSVNPAVEAEWMEVN